ncbi:MAG: hypothetical protein F4184_03095 [Gemmatimonadetes bacterium]|nr:hypothetical protein [Gemmatimonadota bacterium]
MYLGGLFAALVVLAEGLHAQAPRVEATLDTAVARVGDSIRLTLTLHHDATARPEAPDLPQILRDFSPRCADWHQREVATGVELAQECELRLYELGLHEVPAVAVPFVTTVGDTLLRETQPLAIEVISARSEGEDQLRDIKPPVLISGGVPLWVVVAIGLMALALCILGGVWLWRRRTRTPEPPPPPEPIDYAAEFARIAESGLLERGEFKTYYSLLSENLRRFLEESLAVEAMEQTTSELADALQGAEVEGAIRQQIIDYLAAADLVKFARFHPALDAARRAPDVGLAILRAIEEAVASRAVEAHAEHPV